MVTNKKCSTTVGLFETRAAAEKAIADLRAAGYKDDHIGLVAKDASGKTVRTDGAGETHAGQGAAIGAAAGAAGGAAIGAGILAGVIPVIGPVLAIGTLGTILLNAVGGAAIASIAGALVGWGIPEEDAKFYEGEVKAGRYLVTVDSGDRAADTKAVFARHGGYDRSTASTAAGQTVQLKEEQLHATKQAVNTGEVKIHKEVHTDQKHITVPVEREEVVIERRSGGKHAAGGEIQAQEIRIPTREEKVHVSKETVVKEEVSVGKRKIHDTETVSGEVKKEELVVETEGDAKVHQTGKSNKK